MKKLLALLILLAGCGPEIDPVILTEKAKVLQTCYNPGSHGIGVGITTGGDMAVTSVTVEPSWGIVFECKHGQFIVEDSGRESRAHNLWKRLKVGQEVTVRYQEKYHKEGGRRVVVGYRFVDAD